MMIFGKKSRRKMSQIQNKKTKHSSATVSFFLLQDMGDFSM